MLARWFNLQDSNNLIGLDIGASSIKLLKIDATHLPHKIENFAIAELPKDSIVQGEIKNVAVVANILKNLLKSADISSKNIALAIPRSSTISKNINIDSRLSEDEIESRAWIEAVHHFPELVGEIYLDFSIVGTSTQDPAQLEMILVACRKDILKPYLETLNAAGVTAKMVDVNNYALERALTLIAKRTPEIKTIALLNLDLTMRTLIVVQNGALIYSHDETFDGARLMNQLREFPKDSPNYSEMLKEKLSAHLRHTMHFFYSSRPNINIEKLILSGDCSILPNLAQFVQQEIGITTEIADPFKDMVIESMVNKEELTKQAPALMLCCGVALSALK